MKKNAGFVLFETLIVSTIVLGTLIFLFIQLSAMKRAYGASFKYNTIPGLYGANTFSHYLSQTGYDNILFILNNSEYGYVDLTDCTYVDELCLKIEDEINSKTILFTQNDITNLKNNINNLNYSTEMKKFVQTLSNTTVTEKYRLIVEYKNNTFASISVGEDLTKKTKYTLTNLITNGGFESNTNNWNTTGSSNTITITSDLKKNSQGSINYTTSDNTNNTLFQTVSLVKNHKYYYSEYVYLTNDASNTYTNFSLNSIEYDKVNFTFQKKKWSKITNLFMATNTGNYTLNIINSNDVNSINVDNVILVDLTSIFGVNNEPSKEWCDNYIKYFENTMEVYK